MGFNSGFKGLILHISRQIIGVCLFMPGVSVSYGISFQLA